MNDMWVNVGYEDLKLSPYTQPPQIVDNKRIGQSNGLPNDIFTILIRITVGLKDRLK